MNLSLAGGVVAIDMEGATGPLTGRSNAGTWTIPAPPPGRFADIQAPLGLTTHYYDAAGNLLGSISVTSEARDVIADLSGQTRIEMIRSHKRSRSGNNEPEILWARDSETPFMTFPKASRAGTEDLECVVAGADNTILEDLLSRETTLAILHNVARCPVKNCRIPAVRIVSVQEWSDAHAGQGFDGAASTWTLKLLPATVGVPAPVWTWGDLTAAHDTWGGVAGLDSWGMVRDEG